MRLTHLGHACLLVESAGQRILIDPGSFSPGFESVTGLDAILITHQHPDHVDVDRLPALLRGNPGATFMVEPETADALAGAGIEAGRLAAGEPFRVGEVQVTPVGDQHALIHEYVPRIHNLGVVLQAAGEPTLFHPGDAYDAEPGAVDVLALPLTAPWAAVRDTIAFARRIAPRYAVPVHDAVVSPVGRNLYLQHVGTFGPDGMELRDLADGKPADFA
jgi:L-ascorbate metabolism protein UlaG (beta-lactamase superfamily)